MVNPTPALPRWPPHPEHCRRAWRFARLAERTYAAMRARIERDVRDAR